MKKAITFYYCEDSGELVKTKTHKHFKKVDSLMKADVLQDCLGVLEKMYDESGNQYFDYDLKEMKEGLLN
tara:strand:+ start:109 stop:318 length:210 start_codon:yes stop_codon:yes gene_type:complete